MRVPLASGAALLGATTVTGRSIPFSPRDTSSASKVDLSSFSKFTFTTISFEEAKAKAAASTANNTTPTTTSSSPDSQKSDFFALSGTCTAPQVRVEWRRMTDEQRDSFLNAVKCLLGRPSGGGDYTGSQNRYEDLVSLHQKMSGTIHMTPQFLPYHRYYLSVYESLLREECQYAGALPWWDESIDAGNFAASPVFGDRWFGAAPAANGGQGACIGNGAFANLVCHIGPADQISDHCLSRAIEESLTSQTHADFVRTCNSYPDYDGMRRCSEGGPHAFGHNGIGAIMSDVAASPSDPLFFLHHGFIDRNWRAWQQADPAARMNQIGGESSPGVPLTLDYTLSAMNIRPDAKVQDMMDTTGGTLCYVYDSEQL